MFNPRQRPRDINGVVFTLFIAAVLAADYLVLIGKEPFGS